MKHLLILLIISLMVSPLAGQTNSEPVLQISHKTKDKSKYVKLGRNIKVYTADRKTKGRLDSIVPGKLYINGELVNIDEIEKVRFKLRGTQIVGAVVGTGGLLITGAGIAIIAQSVDDNTLGGAIAALIGVTVTAIGLIPTTVGTTIFLIGKSYKDKKWEFEAAELVN
jgi:hypothetical protein